MQPRFPSPWRALLAATALLAAALPAMAAEPEVIAHPWAMAPPQRTPETYFTNQLLVNQPLPLDFKQPLL
jgi:hypothetical protein